MKDQKTALWLSTGATIISFTVWAMVAQAAPILQERYNLSETKISLLIATPVLLGSLMRIPLGIASDRYGGRKVYTLTMFILVVPLIGAGYVTSFEMLLFWSLLIGGAGSTFAIAISYVSHWHTDGKQGYVLGIVGLGNIGTAVAGLIVPTLVAHYGLTWTFWGGAVLMGSTAVAFWLLTKEAPRLNTKTTVKEALSVIKFKPVWILSLFYCLTFGGYITFSLYLPTLLKVLYQLPMVNVGMKTAGFVMVATFIRPFGGYLADRFGAEKILMILFGGIAVIVLLIPLADANFILFSIEFLTLGALLGVGNGAVFKMVSDVAPGKIGAAAGLIGAIGGIGGFILPLVIGATKDVTGTYILGFLLVSLLSLICLLTTIRSIRDGKRSSKEKEVKALPSI